jgi:DNA-binding CsgD family transcriptional regulator
MRPTHLKTEYRYELSARQREVMALLERGLTNAEIADRLGVTLDGAKYHVREILGKLGAESREEAVAIWREMPSRRSPWARFGGGLAGKFVAAAGLASVAVVTVAVVLVMLSRDEADQAADVPPSPVPTSFTPTVTPAPTPVPDIAECTSLDVTLTLETVPRDADVLVRVSASGTTPCRMQGPFVLWPIRPPVDPGPNYPPEANMRPEMKIALDFPFNGVLGEWSWQNWCAEPMPWVAWQLKAPGESGPQVTLSNDFWPPCVREDGPTTLTAERLGVAIDGDVTSDAQCLAAGFDDWLCEFSTSVAGDAVSGRQRLFPWRLSNEMFFQCDGQGSAPGLGDSDLCRGKDAATGDHGYWLGRSAQDGSYSSRFVAEVTSSLPAGETISAMACERGNEACSRFAIDVGGFETPHLVLLFRLEGGREPAIVGAVIGDAGGVLETPFGVFEMVDVGP